LLITTEAMIVEKPRNEKPVGGHGVGGGGTGGRLSSPWRSWKRGDNLEPP
jgi:hypothetical protein